MTKKTFKIKDSLVSALDETINSAENNAGELYVQIIPIKKIQIDPENPRHLELNISDLLHEKDGICSENKEKTIEKESLFTISKSISEQGVINPILVYKENDHYRLIAGQRRTLASILAGKQDIPAKILDTKPSILQISQLQWIENIEREDLTLSERMINIAKIINAYKTLNQEEDVTPSKLSKLLGCSLQQAINYNHILNSSDQIKYLINTNQIRSIDKAATISKCSLEKQNVLIDSYLNGATLKELKHIAHSELKSLESSEKKEIKKEKPHTYSLGKTKNIEVIKFILNSILENLKTKELELELPEINYQDPDSIEKCYQMLIHNLEDKLC